MKNTEPSFSRWADFLPVGLVLKVIWNMHKIKKKEQS